MNNLILHYIRSNWNGKLISQINDEYIYGEC